MNLRMLLAAVVLLPACSTTEYVYTPPQTPEGQACVERCQESQSACRREQDQRAEKELARCEDEAHRREMMCNAKAPLEYAACLKFAKSEAQRAACALEDCTQPACQVSPSYALCGNDFRVCYQSCGGTVGVVER